LVVILSEEGKNSMKCKEYQVNSKIIKCLEENEIIKHSEICLKEQELKKKYPSATEII
jgi:hypothetical protein